MRVKAHCDDAVDWTSLCAVCEQDVPAYGDSVGELPQIPSGARRALPSQVYRYIELNPVRAGIVEHPADYRCSGYRGNANGQRMSILIPHPAYMALGFSAEQRQENYRELFRYHLDHVEIHEIHNAVAFSMPLGNSSLPRADRAGSRAEHWSGNYWEADETKGGMIRNGHRPLY